MPGGVPAPPLGGVPPPPLTGLPPPPLNMMHPGPPLAKFPTEAHLSVPMSQTNSFQAAKFSSKPSSKPPSLPPAKPVQKPMLSRPLTKLKGKLASVFNADESSDEEEIPAEARYTTQYSFIYTVHLQQKHRHGVLTTPISSWEDMFLQNENEKRGSGNDHVERPQQLREDEEGLYRCKQTFREEFARSHGHGVQRQQGPRFCEEIASKKTIFYFSVVSTIFPISLYRNILPVFLEVFFVIFQIKND